MLVRLASAGRRVRLIACLRASLPLALLSCALLVHGCGPRDTFPDLARTLSIDPASPWVGRPVTLTLVLPDSAWANSRVEIEAHMEHPGMAPVIVQASEARPGQYSATVTFTMAGRWILFATGQRARGPRLRARVGQVDVAPAAP
jgi:hypothetical protein